MRPLPIPDGVETDQTATEMLRLWVAHSKLNVAINIGCYEAQGMDEAKAWGVIISDFTRHVAHALSQRYGKDENQQIDIIRESFLKELETPSSDVDGE